MNVVFFFFFSVKVKSYRSYYVIFTNENNLELGTYVQKSYKTTLL